jgi:signal transduction histidine kinase
VGNALKFTEKGFVEISLSDTPEGLLCQVSDTGCGIAKDDMPRLFSKFQQFGRIAGPGEKGTGLGLSIAKGIVELHQGKIWAESVFGQGTKISFILPKRIL